MWGPITAIRLMRKPCNGTATPFDGVGGQDITADAHFTGSVALGDVNGDGRPDLIAGNLTQASRLYLNNGTSDPFDAVTGVNILSSLLNTEFVALHDIDHDGDLDLLSALFSQPNTLHLNDGTGSSFSTAFNALLSPDAHNTFALGVDDFNGDGLLDVVAANASQRDRFHTRRWFSGPAKAASLEIDNQSDFIRSATLTAVSDLPPNTRIEFFLSNNGGQRWLRSQPGTELEFPTFGSDLRWRADLRSRSPILTPRLNSLTITAALGLDAATTWRTQHWTLEELEDPTLESSLWGDAADPDQDEQSNFFEYIAGLTPTDMNSRFDLSIGLVPGQPTHRTIVFSPRLPGRTYAVEAFPNVTSPTGAVQKRESLLAL